MIPFLPAGALFALCIYFIFYLRKWIKSKESVIFIFLKTCLFIYICGIINYTLFPLLVDPVLLQDRVKDFQGAYINFIPFATILEIARTHYFTAAIMQVLLNIVLFIPLGILVPMCFQNKNLKAVASLSLIASLSIELIQFIQNIIYGAPFKFTDIDDVILNVSGGIIGYGIYYLIRPFSQAFLERRIER